MTDLCKNEIFVKAAAESRHAVCGEKLGFADITGIIICRRCLRRMATGSGVLSKMCNILRAEGFKIELPPRMDGFEGPG